MTKIGNLRLALLSLLAEHERDRMLPTSSRFLFYELVQRGIISKDKAPTKPGCKSSRRPDQDMNDALTDLRESGQVPWDWIADETRSISRNTTYESIKDGVLELLDGISLDPWGGEAPFVLTESRSLAGVLGDICTDHGVPIAATNGQCGGFLHTDVVPALRKNQRVLYMGDWDLVGNDIEANTRRVLERKAPRWERIALTEEQVERYRLPVIIKRDDRFTDHRPHQAVETEALSQLVITQILFDKLAELLPEPLESVRTRRGRAGGNRRPISLTQERKDIMNMEPRNLPNTMSEEDYDREREKLRETYGSGFGKMASVEARAKSDMALCKFFVATGWDQRRLAKKEGTVHAHISRRMIFGRFLTSFVSDVTKLPQNLTECRFRCYWAQTESGIREGIRTTEQFPPRFGEEARFDEVLRLIQEDTVAVQQKRPQVGKAIAENFADGKWHTVEEIAAKMEFPEDHVKATLVGICHSGHYGAKCERKEFGKVAKYQLFRAEKHVGTDEMTEKLAPLLERLAAEGKKNMATMSPPTVAYLAAMIQKQIDEWAGKPMKETGLRKVAF